MQAHVEPVSGPLNGQIRVPGSKSITNRALICASLARGTSELVNASISDDTALLVNGLNLLGVFARASHDRLIVEGQGGRLTGPKLPIPVGNAGTTFRFLLSVAALATGTTRFELSPRMAERPIEDLIDALSQLGVSVARDISGLFVSVSGGGIRGGSAVMRGDRSSQFLSSLLLASPLAQGDVSIVLEGPLASEPYVRMTCSVAQSFGAQINTTTSGTIRFDVRGKQSYHASRYEVEPDASGASYPFAAAGIVGGRMSVEGFHARSVQGDAGFLDVLASMGCAVGESSTGVAVERTGVLSGVDVDMNAMPDVVPTLTILALFADGSTRIRNVGHLRFKESNRLETLAGELRKLGAGIDIEGDGMIIHPGPLHGSLVSAHDDHRLAMVFALLGLKVPGIVIEGAECVKKSFPTFWDELQSITAVRLTE